MSFFMVKGGELRRMRVTRFVFSGPVDIVVEGVAKDIVGSFRKAILAALAVKEGKVMSSDALIDVVWAGSSPPTVTNTLQSHISFLRRAFESMGECCGARTSAAVSGARPATGSLRLRSQWHRSCKGRSSTG
ncbi:AfsR/SARP family transcriptional regulator [Thermocatellispora tengchongensis]|uniref:AfsR/SARP family transcriptional regulator n=1 Tax=Thermocatellispora tengchongensis TaxID=1073253 RepID=UPI0036374629